MGELGGRIGGVSFKGRALLRREMEDVAAVFFCGSGEDARETVTVTVMRCCRGSTVILGRTYFWIHTTFKFFF